MIKRKLFAVALAASSVAATTAVVTAPPADAVACVISKYHTTAADYARTTDASGGCSTVWAQHEYNPVWSGNNYWTSRVFAGNIAQSPATAELINWDHGGS